MTSAHEFELEATEVARRATRSDLRPSFPRWDLPRRAASASSVPPIFWNAARDARCADHLPRNARGFSRIPRDHSQDFECGHDVCREGRGDA
jgi:hypothetical protein